MKILDHKKLGFSYAELGAFLGTYMLLKEKVVTHQAKSCDLYADEDFPFENFPVKEGKHTFNMEIPGEVKECGSVGCIGGNMAILMGLAIDDYVHSAKGKKEKLFFPPRKYSYTDIPVSKTLKAMENYARTGNANWAKVLGNKYLDKSR